MRWEWCNGRWLILRNAKCPGIDNTCYATHLLCPFALALRWARISVTDRDLERALRKLQLTRDGDSVCNMRVAPFTDIFTFHYDSAAWRVVSGGTKEVRRKCSEQKETEERKEESRGRWSATAYKKDVESRRTAWMHLLRHMRLSSRWEMSRAT